MVIYDPRGQTWDSWCALMAELFAPQQLGTVTEDKWREWADAFAGNGYFNRSGAPDSNGFETWQDWAFRLLGVVDIDYLTEPNMATINGANIIFPYGAFQDTTTQTNTVNTAQVVTFNTVDFSNAINIVDGSKITVDLPGLYNLQFSVQLQSVATTSTDTSIWLRQGNDGGASTDVSGSTGLLGLPPRQSAINPSHDIKGWNYFIAMPAANDYVQIWWSTTSADVTIQEYIATALPTRPSTASIVATMTFVSVI